MVLIAVGVMLGLWGLYALTSDGGEDADTAADTAQTAPAEGGAPEGEAGGEPPAQDGAEDEANREGSADEAEREGDEADREQVAPAPAEEIRVNVLNNSTVPDYAKNEAEVLDRDGYATAHVGNLPDEMYPETTVYFAEGNPEAERVARELADRYQGVAKVQRDDLPEETRDGQVTVILVQAP
ncbi:LytR cell envelope-related transcriptional attenuator [Corynebacterium camporealensis]|uniref:LytR cell envelope-related transcriptional attenuator n=2 Tax=Corynebacterium camporealensis TaxID=161896 RepID=A0A0F6TBH2_9CORY|nr:LytR cell envelope-related transcriptional attenuator [Corynebacterium camporealensis]